MNNAKKPDRPKWSSPTGILPDLILQLDGMIRGKRKKLKLFRPKLDYS